MIQVPYIELLNFIREKLPQTEQHKRLTSLAVGVSIAKILSLPSAGLEDAGYQYDTVVRHSALQLATTFNEQIVIDLELTIEVARAFWLMRYHTAHPILSMATIPSTEASFAEKWMQLPLFLSPEIKQTLDQNSEVLTILVNRIQFILKDVKI